MNILFALGDNLFDVLIQDKVSQKNVIYITRMMGSFLKICVILRLRNGNDNDYR